MNKRLAYDQGLAAEALAVGLIQAQGGQILAQRCRTPMGEIDIIAQLEHRIWGRLIAFVEVKQRSNLSEAAESLAQRQKERIAGAAEVWLAENPDYQNLTCRFDAILVDSSGKLEWVENAWTV